MESQSHEIKNDEKLSIIKNNNFQNNRLFLV